jgi:hypothetical protein
MPYVHILCDTCNQEMDMPSPNTRRTWVTAGVVVLMLVVIAVALFVIAPKGPPKSNVVVATQPADLGRDVVDRQVAAPQLVDWVGDRKELVVPGVPGAPPRGPRTVMTTVPALTYDARDGGRDNFDHIGYWDPATWVRYNKFDFGKGVSSVTVVAACSDEHQGRVLYFHIDSQDGPVIAEVPIAATHKDEANTAAVMEVTGIHDLYLTCNDGGFNFKSFKFLRALSATDGFPATSYSAMNGIREPRPGIVGHTDDGDWIKYDKIDFGKGVALVAIDLAMGPRDAKIEFHLDKPDGPLIGALVPVSTGDWNTFQIQETPITGAAGVHDLFLTFHGENGLPDLRSIQFRAGAK